MFELADDFNARPLGADVSTANSIFVVRQPPVTPYAPMKYTNQGRSGSRAVSLSGVPGDVSVTPYGLFNADLDVSESIYYFKGEAWIRIAPNTLTDEYAYGTIIMQIGPGVFGISLDTPTTFQILSLSAEPGSSYVNVASAPYSDSWMNVSIENESGTSTVLVKTESGTELSRFSFPYSALTLENDFNLVATAGGKTYIIVEEVKFTVNKESDIPIIPPVILPSKRLVWDASDEQKYFYGLDHGVIYPPDGPAVVWNGLTSVEEDLGQDSVESLYFDGVKYADAQKTSELTTTVRALTYPEELEPFIGVVSAENELKFDNQDHDQFGFSYRTQLDVGYQIHILYNVMAVEDPRNYTTAGDSAQAMEFSWNFIGVPVGVDGFKPTEHYIFDSNKMTPVLLALFESMLYGNVDSSAYLPTINEFVELALNLYPVDVVPQEDGIAILAPDGRDLTTLETEGFYRALAETRLKETDLDGIYRLEED